ncbi:MAG TPA: deoxyribodipyrimidine photo-lyase [Solirubrobacteraceae bacterium]|nr:deoxyribodipyrimidine photo-lyase [Solirubrobacteraceae bacterium]
MSSILWLRRDLRLRDHPALDAAVRAERMTVAFCFDERLLAGRHRSGPRTQFMLESLRELGGELGRRGSRLFVLRGDPATELRGLADRVAATELHFTADVGPFACRRQHEVKRAMGEIGVDTVAHPGLFCVDSLREIRTGGGDPYAVFTPFHRNWRHQPRRDVLPIPAKLPPPGASRGSGRLPTLRSLGLEAEVPDPAPGGERAARRALRRFLDGRVNRYAEHNDMLGADSVSRLSPYLHFGCISPREVEHRLGRSDAEQAFRRQLCWRDFYAHVLVHFPANARQEFQEKYRGTLGWVDSDARFDAWSEGRTGYPVVDAAMRQLLREGWMHNRARLIVGSFLTKDLGIDWRRGERWFMRLLLDGDEASNNGNWQWIASVGVDPQPPSRRMFNPARQQERFDRDGAYVREYVPELRTVPDEYLREPWTMPTEVQKRARCRIGRDYPEPIVDHAEARREALERYRV